ncbi:glycoside hydrolase family 16 protein [Bifidobacterium merycicum]|uniref:Glycoside hydrolase n=1 Tax=Bifidobacterium merycicum TaxID=78345 RepID=A0A087BF38_9BIFI|nr:glycoside hydrolase family 16 protein [Bifidobacterium merycicum]KFI69638.1 glycoside hydrolase [Bifidobacterium merycicum]
MSITMVIAGLGGCGIGNTPGRHTPQTQSEKREKTSLSGAPKGYRLVWSDEFDGTQLDTSKWSLVDWQQAKRTMQGDANHVWVADGMVHLRTTLENGNIVPPKAIATVAPTQDPIQHYRNPVHMAMRYGYAEVRMRFHGTDGSWDAWWSASDTDVNDRKDNAGFAETDIFETNGDGSTVKNALHKWALPRGGGDYASHSPTRGHTTLAKDEWHTLGFLWTPETMTFYLDGKETSSIDITDAGDFTKNMKGSMNKMQSFRDPQYFILNGGASKDSDVDTSGLPFETQIDYVRVYQDPSDSEQTIYDTVDSTKNKTNTITCVNTQGSAPLEVFGQVIAKSGTRATLPTQQDGYRNGMASLKEWNTKEDGSGISYRSGESVTLDKDLVVYAIWG